MSGSQKVLPPLGTCKSPQHLPWGGRSLAEPPWQRVVASRVRCLPPLSPTPPAAEITQDAFPPHVLLPPAAGMPPGPLQNQEEVDASRGPSSELGPCGPGSQVGRFSVTPCGRPPHPRLPLPEPHLPSTAAVLQKDVTSFQSRCLPSSRPRPRPRPRWQSRGRGHGGLHLPRLRPLSVAGNFGVSYLVTGFCEALLLQYYFLMKCLKG